MSRRRGAAKRKDKGRVGVVRDGPVGSERGREVGGGRIDISVIIRRV